MSHAAPSFQSPSTGESQLCVGAPALAMSDAIETAAIALAACVREFVIFLSLLS